PVPPPPRPPLFPYTTLFRSFGIAAGPDGNLWFTEVYSDKVGRLTPGGIFSEFAVPTSGSSNVDRITAGPSGTLAFTESGANKIGDRKSTRLNSSHLVISYAV